MLAGSSVGRFETSRNRGRSFEDAGSRSGKYLLMLLHRQHEAFRRHFEKRFAEASLVHRGPLDERRHLVEQRVVRAHFGTPGGRLAQPLGNARSALVEARDHARFFERLLIIGRIPQTERTAREEAMSARRPRARETEHRAGHHALAVHHHKPVHRAHELGVARAPAHDLRNGQCPQRSRDSRFERAIERASFRRRAVEERRAFGGIPLFESLDSDAVLARESEQRRRRLARRVQADFD